VFFDETFVIATFVRKNNIMCQIVVEYFKYIYSMKSLRIYEKFK